jgi:hypothetical protein
MASGPMTIDMTGAEERGVGYDDAVPQHDLLIARHFSEKNPA